jgi:hypothetical protein
MNRIQKILPKGVILATSCVLPTLGSAQESKAEAGVRHRDSMPRFGLRMCLC